MGKSKEPVQPAAARAALGVSAGAGIALAVSLVILAGAAAGISAGWLVEEWGSRIVAAAALVGGLVGGLCALRWQRHPLMGLGTGLLFGLLLLALGLVLLDARPRGAGALPVLLAAAVGGGLAGLTARPRKRKKRR